MDESKTLHVYRNDATDWFVAHSPEHAAELCKQYHLDNKTNCREDEMGLEFQQCKDESMLQIIPDEDQRMLPVSKTCAEWAAINGEGFLCSENY